MLAGGCLRPFPVARQRQRRAFVSGRELWLPLLWTCIIQVRNNLSIWCCRKAIRPSDGEDFMSMQQRAYFLAKLRAWKDAIVEESRATMAQLQVDTLREPDLADRASSETDWGIELCTRDRQRKLIAKIDAAIRRLYAGEYGYCEVTGEPIRSPAWKRARSPP